MVLSSLAVLLLSFLTLCCPANGCVFEMALSEGHKLECQWMVEELFLNACVPTIRSRMRKLSLKYALNHGSIKPMAYQYSKAYEAVVVALIPESVMFLETKQYKIIKRMNEIYSKDRLTERYEYGHLNASEVLGFLGLLDEDPFRRIDGC